MTRVLVSPADYQISDHNYGKAYNLLANLDDDAFAVDVHTARLRTPIAADDVRVREFPAGNKLSYYARAFRAARDRLRAGDVDVYHHLNLSYLWFNPLLVAGAAARADVPVVIGPCQAGHAVLAEEFNNIVGAALGTGVPRRATDPLHRLLDAGRGVALDPPRRALFERTLRAADRIVVVHEDAKRVYARHVDESKLTVIPLGVDPALFEFRPRRETHDLVAVGSLRERKGYDVLLDALGPVVDAFPDAHLHVFGEGPREAALREQRRTAGLDDHVTFHGFVEQSVLRDHLADARAFVHPSRSESFSLVRLEAMATGCPVVVTDISGAREMVRPDEEGFVVPTDDAGALAEALSQQLGDFDLAARMGRRARDRVEERYDWAGIGRQYLGLYRSLA
jgi:glycosyltransferase involved in cell wall biosynthesis